MVQLKERSWDLVEVGEEFGSVEVVLDDHKIKSYAYAVDDYDPACMEGKPKGKRIGHPIILCKDLGRVTQTKYDRESAPGTGLHAKQAYEILKPVRLGQTVTVTGRYVDKYVRRDKPYMVLETEARDEQGQLVMRGRTTSMKGLRPGVVKEGPAPIAAKQPETAVPDIVTGPVVELASKDTPIGAQVKPVVKQITQEQMTVFTGTGHKSIHTHLEIAKSAGLRDTVAQGLMSACYISEILTKFFGDGWRRGGKTDVAFISPVYVGDTVTATAIVKERIPEGRAQRLVLDVWCENQAGKKVTVGTASGLVR